MSEIKVSICVVTYNQKDYIGPCLESLLEQNCDFKYEIIIGDDASTDGTTDIIRQYKNNYPDKIKLLIHKSNVGAFQNVLSVYKMAKGKYIAHMDGDDLAKKEKLALQAGILDTHLNCNIVSHEVTLIDKNDKKIKEKYKNFPEGVYTLYDLYNELPFFAHSSKMFRNDLNDAFWNELTDETIDIEIHTRQAYQGNIFHINDSLGYYRVFTGISTNNKNVNPALYRGCQRVFQRALAQDNSNKIKKAYAMALLKYAYQSAVLGDSEGAKQYAKQSLNIKLISGLQLSIFFFALIPGLVVWLCRLRSKLKRINSM